MKSQISLTSRLRTGFAIAGLAISLSGCGGSVCTGWSAIYVSKDDRLTPGTSKAILGHNEYGERLGCPAFKPK
ncbi:hypothetical protein XH93_17980 [Bradyrhizobium sp. CCBAU 51753]|nr:hypothetical protein XH93_17980 [Bradyrhizobium sp. CCBAU 51753]